MIKKNRWNYKKFYLFQQFLNFLIFEELNNNK